jgi:hypothetical protein
VKFAKIQKCEVKQKKYCFRRGGETRGERGQRDRILKIEMR